MRILIVEDDDMLRDGLTVGLRLAGFSPDAVATCADARDAIDSGLFQAMVLDVMLPDGSGLGGRVGMAVSCGAGVARGVSG